MGNYTYRGQDSVDIELGLFNKPKGKVKIRIVNKVKFKIIKPQSVTNKIDELMSEKKYLRHGWVIAMTARLTYRV